MFPTDELKPELKKIIIEQTSKLEKKYTFQVLNNTKKYSQKARNVHRLIVAGKESFGNKRMIAIRLLAESLLNEEIPPISMELSDDYDRVTLAAVIIMDNPNFHSYTIGDIVVFTANTPGTPLTTALRSDGSIGNKIPKSTSALRIATGEEINKFVDGLGELACLSIYSQVMHLSQ